MTIRPLKPYIRDANEDLSQVNQFFRDPVDSERGSCDCSNHEVTWGDGAVLPQRFGRIPYALTSKVATQRRDHRPVISLQCVADHKGTLKPDFFSSGLRYPAYSRSKRARSLVELTQRFERFFTCSPHQTQIPTHSQQTLLEGRCYA